MHLVLIFPLGLLYLMTKWKIFLLLLILIVLPTCIHAMFYGKGEKGGGE
jgi:hypothetical protein